MKNKSIAVVLLSWPGLLNFLFTASAQPLVTTLPATGGITLNGTVNPNGRSSLGYFQYGPTTDYGYFGGFTVLPVPATGGTLAMPGFLVNGLTGAAGDNWTNVSQIGPFGPGQGLAAIASSADGLRLAAAVAEGSIFTSTNGGVSWTERPGVPHEIWSAIVSSADGTRLAAANYSGLATIWTSTNSGASWAPTSAPGGLWVSVASSADGLRLVAGQDSEGIYTSTNGGVNWTKSSAPDSRWFSIASSADGLRLAAAEPFIGGGIWTSTNGGVNWTKTSAPLNNTWTGITSSADGQRLAAGQFDNVDGGIWSSTDGGTTWTQTSAPADGWNSVISSADGARLAAISGGNIYTSTNGGADWTPTSAPNQGWAGIASSAGGTRLVAWTGDGGVWTSTGAADKLVAGATYHCRLVGANSAGTGLGGDQTFTMPILNLGAAITGSGTSFLMTLTSSSSLHLAVLASTNLALPSDQWTVLGTMLEIPAGSYRFADVNLPNNARRYYRVRLQ